MKKTSSLGSQQIFLNIVLSEIATSLAALPQKLQPIDDLGNFNTIK